jgi:hypothetical protein
MSVFASHEQEKEYSEEDGKGRRRKPEDGLMRY